MGKELWDVKYLRRYNVNAVLFCYQVKKLNLSK